MKGERLRDFAARVANDAQGAIALRHGGEILTIHPLADEHAILIRLGLRPEDCMSVDGYWSIGGDVVFLQLNTAITTSLREPGLYARVASYPPRYVNLVVVVDAPYITREVLENAARDLLRVGWGHVQLGETLIKLNGPDST